MFFYALTSAGPRGLWYIAYMLSTKAVHQQHVNCLINTLGFSRLKHGC